MKVQVSNGIRLGAVMAGVLLGGAALADSVNDGNGVNSGADVWRDCAAWYMGGGATVGQFAKGDMTDLRHAADPSAATHGGAIGGFSGGISNLVETVYSAASGATLPGQRTIYMAQRDKFDSGVYKVAENGVTLPFAATTNSWTLLSRVRLDEAQPTNKAFVTLFDFGYNGSTSSKSGFALRYYPALEALGLLFNKGSATPKYDSPTNDVCTTLRGKWLEISVTFDQPSEATCRMRVGVGAQGLARTYESTETKTNYFGAVLPYNGKMHLGSTTRYGIWSTAPTAARGSYQMVAYWERVLTDEEILDAFRQEGFASSYKTSAAVLKVGDPEYGAEMLGGTAEDDVTLASADLQDIGKFPATVAAGKTVRIPFTVAAECTNLPQVVRLTGAAGSSGAFDVAIDDAPVGSLSVSGGTGCLLARAELFTQGDHVLSLRRTDAGEAAFRAACVEISGSWRLGWADDSAFEMGGDLGYGGVRTFSVDRLLGPTDGTNYWASVRSGVSSARTARLVATVSAEDAADRSFRFKILPYHFPAQMFHFVVDVNGVRAFDRFFSTAEPYASLRWDPVSIRLPPGTLRAGENTFDVYTEKDPDYPDPAGTWVLIDCYSLEVGRRRTGLVVVLK